MSETRRTGKPPHTNRGVTGNDRAKILAKAAAVDWLTATTDLDHIATDWFDVFGRYSKYREDWKNRWYSGIQAPGLRWGWSETQGYILIASGEMANKVFYDVAPAAKNITRVDLAVDVEMTSRVEDLLKNYYHANQTRRDRRYSLIQNSLGGTTLYVGSRASDQFGRVYDKGVESGALAPGLWYRYEVELKATRARACCQELIKRTIDDSVAHAKLINSFVFDWFDARGVLPIYNPEETDDLVLAIGKKISTDERKVQWLRSQVRPTLQYLVRAGHRELVQQALGYELRDFAKK